jgi:hypothetical protein
MFDISDPKMLWLNITNIALGIITLVCWTVVGYGIVKEVLARRRKSKNTPAASDDHAFLVPGIGITMADGGEKVDIISRMVFKKKDSSKSPSNKKRNSNNEPASN